MKRWLRTAASRDVVRIAARTSAVVGTILNGINYGPELLHDHRLVPVIAVVLNYCVPYAVATYGAVSFATRASGEPER